MTSIHTYTECEAPAVIKSGNTIALQSYISVRWVGCSGKHCAAAGCPGVIFSGGDWTKCWGEVFKIYRADGPGAVKVGDLVGIYYSREKDNWLSCWRKECGKSKCPGKPTSAYGFSNSEKWFLCAGEVFKIYSEGKKEGAVINDGDLIMLYYLHERLWMSQGDGVTKKKSCPGTSRPPPFSKYDGCSNEGLIIHRKP